MQVQTKRINFALVIELERHIEILLLDNDCVIVPDLGGFMAHYVKAHHDDRDGMFLPPMRTLGFNPKLKMNDSLLAQSYIEAYDISYPEAIQRIEDDVNELRQHLENEGKYELADIGTLFLNDCGNYEFEPCEAGILTPELYGLNSFEIAELGEMSICAEEKTENKTIDIAVSPAMKQVLNIKDDKKDTDTKNNKEKTISIRISMLRNFAAAAIAIVAFFVISPPINKPGNNIEMMNISNGALFRLMPKDVTIPEQSRQISKPAVEKEVKNLTKPVRTVENNKKETAEAVTAAQQETSYYTIVLASRITKENAQAYADKLNNDGFDSAAVCGNAKDVKVVYGRYATEHEAIASLRNKRQNELFSQSWVYKVK